MNTTLVIKKRYFRFIAFAICALLINMSTTNIAGYADTLSNTLYTCCILLLFFFRYLYARGKILTSLFLSVLLFNAFFTTFSFLYGMRSLVCIYYFPFLVSFIYMFQDMYSKVYLRTFFFLCSVFILVLLVFCPMEPTSARVTEQHVALMYKKNLLLSFALSAYFFYIIYRYMMEQNKGLMAQKQIAEEASNAKTRFLSVMSHELRTPLNGIIGMINLIDSSSNEQDNKNYLGIVKTSSQHLLSLVNNVLDYSKASAGKMVLTPRACRLDEILNNIHSVFLSRYDEKDLHFELIIDQKIKQTVLIDDVAMVQVLTNLLSNALKFTDRGKVVLHARCVSAGENSLTVEISVSDTGKGISEEQKNKIFDSFNTIDNKARHVESTGLGLSISKTIIELMGGQLGVESAEEKGSVFYFSVSLPFAKKEEPTTTMISSHQYVSMTGLNILVAEDNPVNMIVIRNFLKKWNTNIIEAKNGVEAQEILLQDNDIDLLLLDLQMPEMNGYELMSWIAEQQIPTPTIAFTATLLDNAEKNELFNMGFVDIVPKPFSPKELEEKIKAALKIKSPEVATETLSSE